MAPAGAEDAGGAGGFEGQVVELHGLKATARNGLVGRAGTRVAETGRYPVKLGNGETLLIKEENLRPAAAAAAAAAATGEAEAPRHCKCPLCGVALLARGEDDCIAHMSQCKGFARAEEQAMQSGQLWPPPKPR